MSGFIREARSEAKPFLFVLALVAALGGFLFGYDTGVISGALLFIKLAFHASALQQQAIIGSLLVGAMVGATAVRLEDDTTLGVWALVCELARRRRTSR